MYLRVSTEQQAQNENSIPAQREACIRFIEYNKYEFNEVTDLYKDEGKSGRSDNRRDGFKLMTERLKNDPLVGAVVVYDISRIYRNNRKYLNYRDDLKKRGKKIVSVTEPIKGSENSSDFLLEGQLSLIAEFRSRQDGEKIKNGMLEKMRQGSYPALASFGYQNKQEFVGGGRSKPKRWIETNPIQAPWVKLMFELYSTGGYSFEKLVDELNRRGIPTRKGKPLKTGALEKMLKNKIYIGYLIWGGEENPNGTHEHLVSDETFYKVQALMHARTYGADKSWKHSFLLRGISWCGECGSRINGSYHKKPSGTVCGSYGCPKRQHDKIVECHQSSFSIKTAEKQLGEIVKNIQLTESTAVKLIEKIKQVMHDREKPNEELKNSILARLSNAEVRKQSALQKYVDGDIDSDAYKKYKSNLEIEEARCRAELSRVDQEITKTVQQIETAVGLAKNVYKTYQEATYDQKILLVRTFFEKLIVKDKKIVEAHLNHPFAYLCKGKASKKQEFQRQYQGGSGRS